MFQQNKAYINISIKKIHSRLKNIAAAAAANNNSTTQSEQVNKQRGVPAKAHYAESSAHVLDYYYYLLFCFTLRIFIFEVARRELLVRQ